MPHLRCAWLLAGVALGCGTTPMALAQNPAAATLQSATQAPSPEQAQSQSQSQSQSPVETRSQAGTQAATPSKPPSPPAPSRIDPRTDTGLIGRPTVQTGDQWLYRRSTGRLSFAMRQSVANVNEQGISLKTEQSGSFDSSTTVHDRQWGLLGSGFNDYRPALAYYSFPLYPGKRWGIDSAVSNFGADQNVRMRGEGHAVAWESIDVPAGRFLAMKIELNIETTDPGDAKRVLSVRETHWYARDVMRPVRVESETVVAGEAPKNEIIDLLSFTIE